MNHDAPNPLFDALTEALAPHGFVPVDGIFLHRKTWNTNRGVVLGRLDWNLPQTVRHLIERARFPLRHSWWAQLGMQVVIETDGPPPPEGELKNIVDMFNHQDILVQSVFAVGAEGYFTQARAWGQVVTGKYQDAIARTLEQRRRR